MPVDLIHVLVTAGLCALTFLLGMRVEVRGTSGVIADIKAFNAKVLEEINNVKVDVEKIKNPTPATPVAPAQPVASGQGMVS